MRTAVIVTAPHCTQQTYQQLCTQLAARFGPLELTHQVDETVLGGFLLRLDGVVYDCTLRARLRGLGQHLKGTKEGA